MKEKQEGVQGQWQRESPAKEYKEQVKCCEDTDCTHQDDETGLPCDERRELGRIEKYLPSPEKSHGMGL